MKNLDQKPFLPKETTKTINGFFVIMIFLSHFTVFIEPTSQFEQLLFVNIIPWFGQLMVASFLFFSGFGIFESIKKDNNYINSFFKHRFIPLIINFWFTIILFIIMNYSLGINYSTKQSIQAFAGWSSIGNSNWFIFATFVMYVFILISFNLFEKPKNAILSMFVLTIAYIVFMSFEKDGYWFDTIMCFPLGMIFSYYKEPIRRYIISSRAKKWIATISMFVIFLIFYRINQYVHSPYVYEFASAFFALAIAMTFIDVQFKKNPISWFGGKAFWMLMVQKIPMIIFCGYLSNFVFFATSFATTAILSATFSMISTKVIGKTPLLLTAKNKKQKNI